MRLGVYCFDIEGLMCVGGNRGNWTDRKEEANC